MSSTNSDAVDRILKWLDKNAFWNSDLLNVEKSPTTSGIGVFYNTEYAGDEDNLLLRIPKANILSGKNSFIFGLVHDFHEHHSSNVDVNLTEGMHSVVLSFVYELAAGEESPWFDYVSSIDPKHATDELSNFPICLWTDEEKKLLKNTECDLLGMLGRSELVAFYIECINFARINEQYVKVPAVFDMELSDNDQEAFIVGHHYEKLMLFGKYVQTVISRAFSVDDFHGLSLVPGADLFNHLLPVLRTEDDLAMVEGRENVHFVCDGNGICGVCGEFNCEDHEEDEIIEEEEEIEDNEDNEDGEDNKNEDHDEISNGDDEDEDVDVEINEEDSSSDGSSDEDNSEDHEGEDDQSEDESSTEVLPDVSEITMDYIKEMEQEMEHEEDNSDAETERSDEEVSTLSLSDDDSVGQETEPEGAHSEPMAHSLSEEEELAAQLSDSAQCCDIVLTRPPLEEYHYELFNTYGNSLSNPYLLQRYGFVNNTSEPNINDSCILSVQMFAYLKEYKKNHSGIKAKQLDTKLDWYEEFGFDIVNELVEHESNQESHQDHDHDDHDHENGCCDEDADNDVELHVPESWQLSPVVQFDGSITPQTYALLEIILMPFKLFQAKIINCRSNRKLVKRVSHLLLPYEEKSHYEEIHKIIANWCKSRLSRYNNESINKTTATRREIISNLIEQEKSLLRKAIDRLS